MARRRRAAPWSLIASLFVLQTALALELSQLYLSLHNSLYNNGNWSVTKTELWNGLIGSYAFLFDLQPLAGGALNLAAWHGHQEVVFNRDVDAVAVEFDALFLHPASHLTFSFNRARDVYAGVRVGPGGAYPAAFLEVSAEGEFLRKRRSRKLAGVRVGEWQKLAVRFARAGLSVALNGQQVDWFHTRMSRPQRIAFRGGSKRVLIDNVRIVLRDGAVIEDRFERPRGWRRVIAMAIVAVLAISWGSYLLVRRLVASSDKRLLFFYLMFTGVLVAAAGAVIGLVSYRKGFYPNASEKLKRQEAYWKEASAEKLFSDAAARYPRRPETGTHRIVFTGASQTAGAGARSERDTWVRRAESLLNERSRGPRYECMNAAIRGYRVRDMSRDFANRWVHWSPATLIVNASHNDQSRPDDFARELGRLAERALAAEIQVVLIKEPNRTVGTDPPPLLEMHDLVAGVAERHGLPVIEMHEFLKRRRDDGFVWWDRVHLTPYGHRLFAEHLVDELRRLGVVDVESPPAWESARQNRPRRESGAAR